jgi:hypothetical protein
MVFHATFNNILDISLQSFFLVEETGHHNLNTNLVFMFVVLYRPDIIFHYEILRYTKMSLGSYLLKHRKPHYRVIPEAVRGIYIIILCIFWALTIDRICQRKVAFYRTKFRCNFSKSIHSSVFFATSYKNKNEDKY